uniref:Putative secreted protein n=1 Tax=Amblyomma americanum TaxID=6943 RepID=A0A0C9SEJ9_AMBAM
MNVVGVIMFGSIFLAFIRPLQGCKRCCGVCSKPGCPQGPQVPGYQPTTFYVPMDRQCQKMTFPKVCKGKYYTSKDDCLKCCQSHLTK